MIHESMDEFKIIAVFCSLFPSLGCFSRNIYIKKKTTSNVLFTSGYYLFNELFCGTGFDKREPVNRSCIGYCFIIRPIKFPDRHRLALSCTTDHYHG